jgi:Flp pilus assembly pilin Flp
VKRLIINRQGAAMLEFALIAPLFLTIVCGTVELSRWAWGAAATRDLAARAARCIAVTPTRCGSIGAVHSAMADDAPLITQATSLAFEKSGCGVRVIARGGFPSVLTPGLEDVVSVVCAG